MGAALPFSINDLPGVWRGGAWAQVPPRVDYALSPLGRSMEPVLMALKAWGDAHIGLYGKPHEVAGG